MVYYFIDIFNRISNIFMQFYLNLYFYQFLNSAFLGLLCYSFSKYLICNCLFNFVIEYEYLR